MRQTKLFQMFCRYYYCCEKVKLLENVGLKAIDPAIKGGEIARQMETLNTGSHSSFYEDDLFIL